MEFQQHSEAQAALTTMNKRNLVGREIKVNWASSPAGGMPKQVRISSGICQQTGLLHKILQFMQSLSMSRCLKRMLLDDERLCINCKVLDKRPVCCQIQKQKKMIIIFVT